jgi:hypothetical protein
MAFRVVLGVLVLTSAALTGCGRDVRVDSKTHTHTRGEVPRTSMAHSDQSVAAASSPHGGFGYYAFRYQDSRGTVLIPALPRDDARVAEVDSYRTRAGIPTIGYTVLDLDNTHGSSPLSVTDVTVLPTKGPNWEADTDPAELLELWKAPTDVVHRYARQTEGVARGHRRSLVLMGEFPLTEKPREVLVTVSAGREHRLHAKLVKETHPYADRGLAQTGR